LSSVRDEDVRQLEELLRNHDHELSDHELEAFTAMRADLAAWGIDGGFRELSEGRRRWLRLVMQRVVPHYENLVSRGLVPRGKEVPTPPVLQRLPMKPPRKRASDDE
jgi:hypothetical protein